MNQQNGVNDMNELNLKTEESRKASLNIALEVVLTILDTIEEEKDEGNFDALITDFINKLMGFR